jgi:hypothetical protein
MGVERWEDLCCGRKGQTCGAWSLWSLGAKSVPGVMAMWPGDKPLGTTLTLHGVLLGLLGVSYRYSTRLSLDKILLYFMMYIHSQITDISIDVYNL